LVLAGAGAAAADPEPLPSGLDTLGSASPDDVARALRKIRRKYGDDAIVIETQLLVNAMRNGSLRATEVRVDGVQPDGEQRFLVFAVETGLVFDTATRDETTRVHMLWQSIVEPTLAHLKDGLRVPADGIKIALRYHHRPYRTQDELRASLEQPGTPEETDFYVLVPHVDALLRQTETPHSLIARTRVTVDGAVRTVAAVPSDLPSAPGPD
jgi:hypothetical protein